MPPASLSTFAVMNPGPTTAKNSRIRLFQRLRKLMRAVHEHKGWNLRQTQTTQQNKRSANYEQTKSAGRGILNVPDVEPRLQKHARRRFGRSEFLPAEPRSGRRWSRVWHDESCGS